MFEITCPTLAATYTAGREELLSTHRVASGATGYARCICGGMAVLSDQGQGWRQTGHATGPRTPALTATGPTATTTPVAHRCA